VVKVGYGDGEKGAHYGMRAVPPYTSSPIRPSKGGSREFGRRLKGPERFFGGFYGFRSKGE
jgi:hypothetical protein